MTQPALELSGVEYSYRRNAALRGVTLQVKPGEVVAVTGASGCGKSTLLHCAAGILVRTPAAVRVAGQDLALLPEDERARLRRTKVGIVLQFGQLVPDLPLIDNVALPLLLDGHERAVAHESALDWLKQVGVADEADAVPAELSGGQTQRAAVARALVTGPSVVLADEPTGSLDSKAGQELLDVLLKASRHARVGAGDGDARQPRCRLGGPGDQAARRRHPARGRTLMTLETLVQLARSRTPADRSRIQLATAALGLSGALLLGALRIARLGKGELSADIYSNYVAESGLRSGLVAILIILALLTSGLAVQALRLGTAARERRLAALRLAGASRKQVRKLSVTDAAMAGLAGGLLAGPIYLVLSLLLGALPRMAQVLPGAELVDLLIWVPGRRA